MAPSLFQTTLIALSLASRAIAFEDITIPSTVAAGEDVKVTIKNDLISGPDSSDSQYTKYNVYLSSNPPGSSYNPVCLLINNTAIDVTDLTVLIPASVGPNANNYSLIAVESTDDIDMPLSDYQYSNDFTLTGATGVWSEFELEPTWPYQFGIEDFIPCTAYDCARSCYKGYDGDKISQISDFEPTWNCVAACPGVTFPSWETVLAGYDDEVPNEEDDGNYSETTYTDDYAASTTSSCSSTATIAAQTTSVSISTLTTSATSSVSTVASTQGSSATGSSTASASTPLATSSSAAIAAAISRYALLGALLASIMAVAHL